MCLFLLRLFHVYKQILLSFLLFRVFSYHLCILDRVLIRLWWISHRFFFSSHRFHILNKFCFRSCFSECFLIICIFSTGRLIKSFCFHAQTGPGIGFKANTQCHCLDEHETSGLLAVKFLLILDTNRSPLCYWKKSALNVLSECSCLRSVGFFCLFSDLTEVYTGINIAAS